MQDLLEMAHSLLPELRERSQEIDDLRQLPQDLAQRMADAGFYRLIGPQEIGGLERSTKELCELVELLASANGSAAWCVFISATSQLNTAAVTGDQRNLIASPGTITSGVFAPSGTAVFENTSDGPGYRINGHWRWGSSSRNADWIFGALTEVDGNGEPVGGPDAVTRAAFQPNELEMPDNWHVSGLKGSGSGDYLANDLWLPAARLGKNLAGNEFGDRKIYRFPLFGTLGAPCGAIAMGMARAAVEEVIAVAREKTPQGSRRTLSQRAVLHRDLAVMDTSLRAARALFYQTIDEIWAAIETREATLQDRVAIRTANVHAMNTAVEVIDRMYSVVGGSSIWAESCLQRMFRDVHVASQHMMVGEPVMELAGRVMLGLDDQAPGL
ncbi:MAG: acyl-CoA dehydrogenase family protein [Pseudomonadales bacterium]